MTADVKPGTSIVMTVAQKVMESMTENSRAVGSGTVVVDGVTLTICIGIGAHAANMLNGITGLTATLQDMNKADE